MSRVLWGRQSWRQLRLFLYTGFLQRILLSVAVCAALAVSASASPQTTTKKKPTTAKAATKTTTKHPVKKAPVVAHHPQQPSTERYKEIQQALASKGYFTPEPDGNWGPASIESLKRFQHDQNLVEDGKIGSLSLIALGLGPKREPMETEQK
jgi:peptidoglycan hydrolase-like protein with peptidoglycan-binding domain